MDPVVRSLYRFSEGLHVFDGVDFNIVRVCNYKTSLYCHIGIHLQSCTNWNSLVHNGLPGKDVACYLHRRMTRAILIVDLLCCTVT